MIRKCKRRIHHFPTSERIPQNETEWLALIQHFGGPTRLLDFTLSPFVAIFLALEKAVADT